MKPGQVKSCLRCKYSAVKHISIDKAWNKQHRLGESRLTQSLNQAYTWEPTLNDCQVAILQVKHKTWVQNETKKTKCAQFQFNSQKYLKNHVLYISHIRVNTQQAFAILLDLKTYVMLAFWYYWKYNTMQQVLHIAAFFYNNQF